MRVQSCDVSPQGDRITIALPEQAGELRTIALSFDEASALAMTLPRLLSTALRRRFSDDRLRHVYALSGFKVECASDLRHLLVTMAADDGFDVAFAVKLEAVPPLAPELLGHRELLERSEPLLPN
ncbi:hypothetical protein [Bosea sp. TAF32]|uniref:hypothetical protein n=1 Tax=Bosea sp. TAF32 TaxID=3237482 RepID=UPI003F92C314